MTAKRMPPTTGTKATAPNPDTTARTELKVRSSNAFDSLFGGHLGPPPL